VYSAFNTDTTDTRDAGGIAVSRTDGASERRSDNRPALQLQRRPIIKPSLPTSPRLRRAGRDGTFSVPKRAKQKWRFSAGLEFGHLEDRDRAP
jgi:hypothetical protein